MIESKVFWQLSYIKKMDITSENKMRVIGIWLGEEIRKKKYNDLFDPLYTSRDLWNTILCQEGSRLSNYQQLFGGILQCLSCILLLSRLLTIVYTPNAATSHLAYGRNYILPSTIRQEFCCNLTRICLTLLLHHSRSFLKIEYPLRVIP